MDGVNKPKLWYYLPVDYWYLVEPLPDSFWTACIDIVLGADPEKIAALLPPHDRVDYMELAPQFATRLGIEGEYYQPAAGAGLFTFSPGLQNRL